MAPAVIRLAALGLSHETNTFAVRETDLADFEAAGILRGDAIRADHDGARTTMAGFLAAGQWAGVDVVPLLHVTVTPSGMITDRALATVADQLAGALEASGPFDGILAALHGAAVARGTPDVDGYLLRRFRGVAGPATPIGAALDLHANISGAMAEHADVLVTYRTNPHVDAYERAVDVARLIAGAARGEIRPAMTFEQVPAAINILCQNTGSPPMAGIIEDLETCIGDPCVLTASVAEGYPYADVTEMGMSVIVVTDGDRDGAATRARHLATRVWARRGEFDRRAPGAAEALRQACDDPGGPLLLLDVGDNIGAGSPGDSVDILAEALKVGVPSLLTIVVDPEAAAACAAAGVAGRAQLSIGGRADPLTGPPVGGHGTVLALHSGRYEDPGPTHAGIRYFDAGPTAAVRLDTGQTVVLCSRAEMPISPVQVTSLGLDPANFKVIIAKGVHSPLAGYGPLASRVIQVDTPGVTGADLRRLHYTRRRSPLYPFEPDARYPLQG
jgi:microcystin degradation protein MlrC